MTGKSRLLSRRSTSVPRGAIEAALLPGTFAHGTLFEEPEALHGIPVKVIVAETTPLHERRVIG